MILSSMLLAAVLTKDAPMVEFIMHKDNPALSDVIVNNTCTVYDVPNAVLSDFDELNARIIRLCGPDYALDKIRE